MGKVHLHRVDGSIYCGSGWRGEEKLLSSPTMAEVTCKRCLRRYYRLPINAVVTEAALKRYGG